MLTSSMPELPWGLWLLGALACFFVGIAKTGLPGFGILAIPMMVITVGDARLSAGWLLPILCAADVIAILYWRRMAVAGRLFSLAPWVVAGMAAGAAALALEERYLRPLVATIILAMLALYIRRRLRPDTFDVPVHPAPYGFSAGFSTTVANAAGPVMNLYLLSKRLPKEEFVATGAWFFFAVNLSKVPIYWWHGLFSRKSLLFDLAMLPALVSGAVIGRWVIHLIPQRVFEILVIVMTTAATLLLYR